MDCVIEWDPMRRSAKFEGHSVAVERGVLSENSPFGRKSNVDLLSSSVRNSASARDGKVTWVGLRNS